MQDTYGFVQGRSGTNTPKEMNEELQVSQLKSFRDSA